METCGEHAECFDDFRPPPPGEFRLCPSEEIRRATFTLLLGGQFAGTALAVGPRLVVTAGHHFRVTADDPGQLRLRNDFHRAKGRGGAGVAYVQKDRVRDLMLLWPEEDLPFVTVRAYSGVLGARVATAYCTPHPPHRDLVVSPGQVCHVSDVLCRSLGTVTTQGASGAPVIDSYGDRVVGLHLSVSDSGPGGSWVSEFAPARSIVGLLRDAAADPQRPYRAEEDAGAAGAAASTSKSKTHKQSSSSAASATAKKHSPSSKPRNAAAAKATAPIKPTSAAKKSGTKAATSSAAGKKTARTRS